jgi:hypothetical protein
VISRAPNYAKPIRRLRIMNLLVPTLMCSRNHLSYQRLCFHKQDICLIDSLHFEYKCNHTQDNRQYTSVLACKFKALGIIYRYIVRLEFEDMIEIKFLELRNWTRDYEVSAPDGRSGIIRVSSDGSPVANGILGESSPLNLYYAYGIRNSFGLDFDPINGNLWDTENGPHYGDEINLVDPGFNSGWATVEGFWTPNLDEMGNLFVDPDMLVNFDGKGNYSRPEFVWVPPVAPTALKFLNSDKLGSKYAPTKEKIQARLIPIQRGRYQRGIKKRFEVSFL